MKLIFNVKIFIQLLLMAFFIGSISFILKYCSCGQLEMKSLILIKNDFRIIKDRLEKLLFMPQKGICVVNYNFLIYLHKHHIYNFLRVAYYEDCYQRTHRKTKDSEVAEV